MPLDKIPVRVRIVPAMFSLVVVAVLWIGVAGVLAIAAMIEMFDVVGANATGFVCLVGIVLVWLAGGAIAILHLALDAYRFTFGRTALRVFGWSGRRTFDWNDVKSARLVSARFGVSLVLTFEGDRRVSVPLLDYFASGRLLADIEDRLPVAVSAPSRLKEQIERSDRSVPT